MVDFTIKGVSYSQSNRILSAIAGDLAGYNFQWTPKYDDLLIKEYNNGDSTLLRLIIVFPFLRPSVIKKRLIHLKLRPKPSYFKNLDAGWTDVEG